MSHLEAEVDEENGSIRQYHLKRLHEVTVDDFINSRGFGVGRMNGISRWMVTRGLRNGPPLRQPGIAPEAIGSLGEMRTDGRTWAEGSLYRMHAGSVLDFVHPMGFGYVKDRRNVTGFQAHQFSRPPEPAPSWQLQHLDLIGLLLHEKPVAYVSDHLPRMDELRKAPTRPLDVFQTEGLASLQDGQDLFVRDTTKYLRVLGAIRSVKQCLGCHGGESGDLLGAFSYALRRGER